jgi:hypothetical protein
MSSITTETLLAHIASQLDEPNRLSIVNPVLCEAIDYAESFQLVNDTNDVWLLQFSNDEGFEAMSGTLTDMVELFVEHCNQCGY